MKSRKDDGRTNQRRIVARDYLLKQLETKTKPGLVDQDGSATWQAVPLDEDDVKRIKKELTILNSRITLA